jgi:hypothetical protein
MKLLLDENVPRKLKFRLSRFQVFTVHEMGWAGMSNGILLTRMLAGGFDALIIPFVIYNVAYNAP